MTDHDALLLGICAEPDRDLPRLVYADWLDESEARAICGECKGTGWERPGWEKCGECLGAGALKSNGFSARAEFIRLQVRAAEAGDEPRAEFIKSQLFSTRPRSLRPAVRNAGGLSKAEEKMVRPGWLPRGLADLPAGVVSRGGVTVVSPGRVTWSRGFVHSARLTAGQLLGGPCGACASQGTFLLTNQTLVSEGGLYRCVACGGTGATAGVRGSLFSTHPVTEVTLSDREPFKGFSNWSWYDAAGQSRVSRHAASDLPGPLFDEVWWLTPLGNRIFNGEYRYALCATQEVSEATLSRAAVNVCRLSVGLGRLYEPEDPQ